MKQKLTLVKVLSGIVFISLVTMGLKSCTGKNNFVGTQDTMQVVGRQPNDLVFVDSAIVRITKKRKLDDDSSSLSASFRTDTAVYLLQVIDTLRDSLKHPLFYPNHAPKMLTRYSPLPVDDSLLKYVQLITIPRRK
jgi:hypothetical protein